MSELFKNRVFGSVIVKSINSNFNADFTGHPRTLPDGTVYATDKALKYALKDYFRKTITRETIFYVKRMNDNLNPRSLNDTYEHLFGDFPTRPKKAAKKDKEKEKDAVEIVKSEVLRNLLKCIDIRLFGATFAGDANISIHGPVQINHGVNRFPNNDIYTESILSPFRNEGKKDAGGDESEGKEKENSTIGNQTNLKEGHYVYHFSINPANLNELVELVNAKEQDEKNANARVEDIITGVKNSDIVNLKKAFNNAVTFLDSSRKIGSENEATLWVELKEGSIKMLPSFTELINVTKNGDKSVIDFTNAVKTIEVIKDEIQSVELYFNPITTEIVGMEEQSVYKFFNILQN